MKVHNRELEDVVLVRGMSGDYGAFMCAKCGAEAKVVIGMDPSVMRIDFECEGCGATGMSKIVKATSRRVGQ